MMDKIEHYSNIALEKAIFYLPKVLLALVILWLGFKLVKKLAGVVDLLLEKSGLSETIRPFLVSIVTVMLKVTLLFVVSGVLGIELSIFATIIAASVFAIGMALQGSLGNFASGLIVLFIRPYKVNDWIQLEDKFGKVVEIGIFNTKVLTPGNKNLIIPNSKITTSVVTNYSENDMIRLELEVTMPYHESFPKVKMILENALKDVSGILKNTSSEIGIVNFDSHNIVLAIRPCVHPDDFWAVTYASYAAIKKAFSENNIQVAYSEGVELGQIGV